MRKVKARKDYVLGFSTRGVEQRLRSNPMIIVYQGHVRFTSRRSVTVAAAGPCQRRRRIPPLLHLQAGLPRRHLVQVDVELMRDLRNRPLALDRRNRDFALNAGEWFRLGRLLISRS